MTKAKIQLGLIIILIITAGSLLFSLQANPYDGLFFGLKRVQENNFLKLKSNPADRVEYMSRLLNARLEELKNTVNAKRYDSVLPAASRYSTLAGQITDLVIANNLTGKVDGLKNQFLSHQKVIDAIYVAYPKNTDNVEYKYIQDDYNYLKIYLDQLASVR